MRLTRLTRPVRALLSLAVLCAAPAASAAPGDALHAAILTGDRQVMAREIEALYAAAGASLNDYLDWQSQPFDQILNWYNENTQVIMLSDPPRPHEVAPYWRNWSAALTGGRWDWRAFFADEEEAGVMASFNQFVLAAHEYGHALTYRYDPSHNARAGHTINCREYPADRLAAALLRDLSRTDPRFAALEARYADLVASFNAAIAPAERHTLASHADLAADCTVLHIVQPTETTMAPYASAYFARWSAMLAAELPTLPEIYRDHLFPHLHADLPPQAGLAGAVTSLPPLGGLDPEALVRREGETAWRLPGFAPDGSLFLAEITVSGEPGRVALDISFGPAGADKLKPVLSTADLGVSGLDGNFVRFEALAAVGPERFAIASTDLFNFVGGVLVIVFTRDSGAWRHEILTLSEPYVSANALLPNPDGSLALLLGRANWTEYRLTLDPPALKGPLAVHSGLGHPVARTAAGTLIGYERTRPMLLVPGPDGAPLRLAGSGLTGFKDDPDPLRAEFANPLVAIALPTRLRFLAYDPFAQTHVLRELALPEGF